MAATGFTPISLYYSATAAAVPLAANLVAGELSLNTNDGKLYYKNSSNVVTLLAAAAAATGTVSSVAQSFTGGIISVGGSPITTSGTLALTVAGTSGGIPYFSSASTWATSAALTASALMVGGGAGAAPSTVTTGTGVVTALGVNTGSAGAFVVNGGALGTPSSGTVTNLTGTASININGTVGATTASTGVFTTVTINGTSSATALTLPNIAEVDTISATAATGTINYDITTQSVLYYTSNASGNWTLNFRGSSGTSLNTLMSTGQSISATFLVTNGSTAYYNSAVTIDGTSVTPKWQGGSAPTSGNASSTDCYTYVLQKTGSATYVVLASQTKFA
jgi:hypothetical protein